MCPKKINDVLATLKRVDEHETSLTMLLEFEKTLDNAGMYAYENWMEGELVEGPDINRYWFTTTWMYPAKLMPNPDGGLRLIKYGCKVSYKKDYYLEPTKVLNLTDIDASKGQSKAAKIERRPVWLVTIEMPRRFVDEAQEGILRIGDVEIDIGDINAAWDENLEDAGAKEVDVDSEADAREADFDPEEKM